MQQSRSEIEFITQEGKVIKVPEAVKNISRFTFQKLKYNKEYSISIEVEEGILLLVLQYCSHHNYKNAAKKIKIPYDSQNTLDYVDDP